MSLNLGLESLTNRAHAAAFTPEVALEMLSVQHSFDAFWNSFENYYDAARNAVLIKNTIKKYGKTQSLVALIGQEGLATALAFSMEGEDGKPGFWAKIKEGLKKAWDFIVNLWQKFIGLFINYRKRLEALSKATGELKGEASFTVSENCKFPQLKAGFNAANKIMELGKKIAADPQNAGNLMPEAEELMKSIAADASQTEYTFTNIGEVNKFASELLTMYKGYDALKTQFDNLVKQGKEMLKKLDVDADSGKIISEAAKCVVKIAKIVLNVIIRDLNEVSRKFIFAVKIK